MPIPLLIAILGVAAALITAGGKVIGVYKPGIAVIEQIQKDMRQHFEERGQQEDAP